MHEDPKTPEEYKAFYEEKWRRELDKVRRIKDLVRLRCGYILGMCRGEQEMRLEAQELINTVEKI